MSLLLCLVLASWVSHISAIPLGPLGSPEYALVLSNIPLFKNYWDKHAHKAKLSSTKPPPQEGPPGWYDPRDKGGRMLDFTTIEFGEPLNVIISGHSDPFILTDSGLHFYAKSLGFSEECLGLHIGNLHRADLGDGDDPKIEQFLARQHYFPIWGTCWESLAGGHHFRAWKQNGTLANSGAWFIGASKEHDSRQHHRIVPNGYNLGRDWIVDHATSGSRWKGISWRAEVEWRTDLLEEGNEGVNHGIAQDGRVAVLTIHRT